MLYGATAKQSVQVQERDEKVNPVQKIKSLIITTKNRNKNRKLVYPYDMIASNEPERGFDGIDMGGVEVVPT